MSEVILMTWFSKSLRIKTQKKENEIEGMLRLKVNE